MFVVRPLMEDADLRAFLSLAAASEYAEAGVFQDCGCEQSEIHFIDGAVTADEAVAAVKDGLSEKRTIVHRRMSPEEIEVARLDALADRELGP
jgi:coenzyme F420-reducing hydrogenase delta subunit